MQQNGGSPAAYWIVDDSAFESASRASALLDYEVVNFNYGSAALERLAADRPPDVLVLDLVMPG